MARASKTDDVCVHPWTARAQPGRGEDRAGRLYWRARCKVAGVEYSHSTRAHRDEIPAWLKALPLPGSAPEAEPAAEVSTVQDLLELWAGAVAEDPSIAAATRDARIGAARRLVRALGREPIAGLRRGLLDSYARGQGTSSSPGTRRLDLQCARAAWRWAAERDLVQGYLPRTPLPRPEPAYAHHTPTPGEVAQVVTWLDAQGLHHHALSVRLLHALGARVSEVTSLTWDRVDLDAIPPRATVVGKTGPRTIALPPVAVELLQPLDRSAPITRSTPGSLRHAIRRACEAAGLPHWSPKGERAAMVDRLYRRGHDFSAAAAFLGHSPETAVAYYRRVEAADQALSLPPDLGRLPRGEVLRLQAKGPTSGAQSKKMQGQPNNSHLTMKGEPGEE